jgi:glutamine phosphoribosylpyrophosphate amidotransferase
LKLSAIGIRKRDGGRIFAMPPILAANRNMSSYLWDTTLGKFYKHHGMGLVPQIFNDPKILHDLVGDMAIGHTRYSTTGTSNLRNAQPLTVDCARGQIAVAHNGNLTNAAALRDELESAASFFRPPWTARSSS